MPKLNTSQFSIRYYETDGSVIACVGLEPVAAMCRIGQSGGRKRRWEFIHPESPEFDYFHQYIFRNLKASLVEKSEQASLPPLPEEINYEDRTRESFYGPSSGFLAGDYAALHKILMNRTVQSCSIFAVLDEDTYETFVGDGCYLYLESAFFAQSEAENRVSQINASDGHRGHLRKMTLELADGRFSIPDLKLEIFDHYSVQEVLDKLNQHVSNE